MAKAAESLSLLPDNEFPPPPSIEDELVEVPEDTPAKPVRKARKRRGCDNGKS